VKKSQLREETYRILKTLAQVKSFGQARKKLPGLTDADIWKAISNAASVLGDLARVERHRSLNVYIDGAAVPNPGPSGIGVVIYNERKKKVKEVKKSIGLASNNMAEYEALIQGLKESKKLSAGTVNIFSDSELLVNQMSGKFRINDRELKALFQQAKSLENKFEKVSYRLIARDKNKVADQLANIAVEKR